MYRFVRLSRKAIALVLLSVAAASGAQENAGFAILPPDERWTVTTRWDYRVRIDGTYLGFANRELREVYRRGDELSYGWDIEGDARVLGATKKNGVSVAARLEESEEISFQLSRDGTVLNAGDGYPRLRGFPTFPEGSLEVGDRWEAPLDILVRGPDDGRGLLQTTAAYEYLGIKPYAERDAHYFSVNWAIRYDGYDPYLDSFLKEVHGSHSVSLVIDAETMAPIMARDNLSERWQWADSRVEQRDGFALIFWKGVPPLDKGGIRREFYQRFPGDITSLSTEPADNRGMTGGGTEDILYDGDDSPLYDPEGGIVILETPRGISVTLRNLHFEPDLAVLLPGEEASLNQLAAILDTVPGRTVLVRGHTADVGRPEDEMNLSEDRARVVAEEMIARGIDASRLIYEGVGAGEPAASNSSEEGRRLNRRVELVILED